MIADATREFHGCLGVWGGYARQTRILHNEICRVAYGGLSLGWCALLHSPPASLTCLVVFTAPALLLLLLF